VIAEPSCAACGEKGCEYGFGPARAGVGGLLKLKLKDADEPI
jgi:hypothetical protein